MRQRFLVLPAGYDLSLIEIDFDVQLNERVYIDLLKREFVCTYINTSVMASNKVYKTPRGIIHKTSYKGILVSKKYHLSLTNS